MLRWLLYLTTLPPGDPAAPGLIEAALAGPGAARDTLVQRLTPVIRARVRRRLARLGPLGSHDGDDLVQDIWCVLVKEGGRQLRAYDPGRGASLENYVGRIAEREVGNRLDKVRALKRGGGVAKTDLEDIQVAGEDGSRVVSRATLASLLTHLDASLPARGKLVLRLLYADGLKPAEAANVMGVNTQVVYNWQHRIRGMARDFAG